MQPLNLNQGNLLNHIIRAAEISILLKGYENVEMKDIADEAGIDPNEMHQFFYSKENLFEIMIDSYFKDYENFIKELRQLSVEERVSRIVDYIFDMSRKKQYPIHFSIYLCMADSFKKPQANGLKEKLRNHYVLFIQIIIIFLIKKTNVSNEEVEVRGRLLFAFLDGLFLQVTFNPDLVKNKEVIKKTMLNLLG